MLNVVITIIIFTIWVIIITCHVRADGYRAQVVPKVVVPPLSAAKAPNSSNDDNDNNDTYNDNKHNKTIVIVIVIVK